MDATEAHKIALMCVDVVESKYQILDKCKLLFDLVVHHQQHLHCFRQHSSSFDEVWEKFHQMSLLFCNAIYVETSILFWNGGSILFWCCLQSILIASRIEIGYCWEIIRSSPDQCCLVLLQTLDENLRELLWRCLCPEPTNVRHLQYASDSCRCFD